MKAAAHASMWEIMIHAVAEAAKDGDLCADFGRVFDDLAGTQDMASPMLGTLVLGTAHAYSATMLVLAASGVNGVGVTQREGGLTRWFQQVVALATTHGPEIALQAGLLSTEKELASAVEAPASMDVAALQTLARLSPRLLNLLTSKMLQF